MNIKKTKLKKMIKKAIKEGMPSGFRKNPKKYMVTDRGNLPDIIDLMTFGYKSEDMISRTNRKHREMKRKNPDATGELSPSGVKTLFKQYFGTLQDFVQFKMDAAIGSGKYYSKNTIDKYFHSLGFCIATMEIVLDYINKIRLMKKSIEKSESDPSIDISKIGAYYDEIVKTSDEDLLSKALKESQKLLKDAGTFKEAFYDYGLKLGTAGTDDLEANDFGMKLAFKDNWRQIIYDKYVPEVKNSFYKAFISGGASRKDGTKIIPHFTYIHTSNISEYSDEFDKAEEGKSFKFIAPPYNAVISQKERSTFTMLEKSLDSDASDGKYAGFSFDQELLKKFNNYISVDYNKKLNLAFQGNLK